MSVADKLAGWGIVEVIGAFRGAVVHQESRHELSRPGKPPHDVVEVTVVKRRSSFTSECLDCGPAPHVSPDDHAIAVCLRCGRDKWL